MFQIHTVKFICDLYEIQIQLTEHHSFTYNSRKKLPLLMVMVLKGLNKQSCSFKQNDS